ncbi:hypothetical protein DOY81_014651, partial [Sarcophaga bullata]
MQLPWPLQPAVVPLLNQTHFKVIIIGAGMSGLSAANHLVQNGCDNFCILEGRGRIGGRIVSIPLGQQKIDLLIIVKFKNMRTPLLLFLSNVVEL